MMPFDSLNYRGKNAEEKSWEKLSNCRITIPKTETGHTENYLKIGRVELNKSPGDSLNNITYERKFERFDNRMQLKVV